MKAKIFKTGFVSQTVTTNGSFDSYAKGVFYGTKEECNDYVSNEKDNYPNSNVWMVECDEDEQE